MLVFYELNASKFTHDNKQCVTRCLTQVDLNIIIDPIEMTSYSGKLLKTGCLQNTVNPHRIRCCSNIPHFWGEFQPLYQDGGLRMFNIGIQDCRYHHKKVYEDSNVLSMKQE